MSSTTAHVQRYRRLARRSLGSLLHYKFIHEYGYDKGEVVAAAIVEDIVGTVRAYYRKPGDLEPGQLVYNAAAADERGGRGKTITRTRLIPVTLTILADEDIEAIGLHLSAARRREIRIRRITNEAKAQGAALTETDISVLFGWAEGLVSYAVTGLRKQGEWLPIRGYVADMGIFPTHKAAIVKLYLDGLTTPDIASRTSHSKEAVDNYIRGFERVRLLADKYKAEELPLLTGMTMPLVQQYLHLLAEHGMLRSATGKRGRRASS